MSEVIGCESDATNWVSVSGRELVGWLTATAIELLASFDELTDGTIMGTITELAK